MKKSLIALAVLAASGASFAQSTVSVYGIVDASLAYITNDNGTTSTSTTNMLSGAVSGSRWGLKGSEDLGGGLKANFKLEQGFNVDSGSAGVAGQAFSRYSYVGFSGGFGEIKLGKTGTAYDDVQGASDAVFDSALSPMNSVFKSTGYAWNPDNTIYYQAPTYSGFSGALSYSLGEDKTAVLGASSTTSLNLTYGAGPLAVNFGYQTEDKNTTADDTSFTRLGAAYTFGPATLKATYGKTSNIGNVNGADATDWQLGADYAVSTALTVSASLAQSADNVTAGDFTRKGFGLGAAYTLSKRTFVYGGYEADTTTKTGLADTKHSVFAVGVQHNF